MRKIETRGMSRKDKKFLCAIYDAVLHPQQGIKAKLDFILNEIMVNGEKGLENVLKSQNNQIRELTVLTSNLRSKYSLKRAIHIYMKGRPIISGCWRIITNRKVLLWLIALLLTIFGLGEIVGYFK